MAVKVSHKIISFVTVLFLLFILSINIDSFFYGGAYSTRVGEYDPLYKVLGELRQVLSATLFLKADEYYHGGTKHPHGSTHKKHFGDCCMHNEGEEVIENSENDIFERVIKKIKTRSLRHLKGEQLAELLPLFYLSTKVNPYDINAYVNGGFWLSAKLNMPDKALSFLEEGLRFNPSSYQILMQIGDIYFLIKKDYYKSAAVFQRAYILMQDKQIDIFERKHLLTFLAASFERTERFKEALYYYEEFFALDNDTNTEKKINELKAKL